MGKQYFVGNLAYELDGKIVDYPVMPYIVSNRLFVEVEIPFLNEKRKILMSDDMESELTQLPQLWDCNYNSDSNIYEIVNEFTNPVLQVIYKSANEIQVNGIFIVDTNLVMEAFGGPPRFGTIKGLEKDFKMNTIYDTIFESLPNRRAIFKYPSDIYPHECAE